MDTSTNLFLKPHLKFPHRFFVTGTGTGIGKTLVSSFLVSHLQAHYWKPIQTGIKDEEADTETVRHATKLPPSHFHKEAYKFLAPLSPHAAAFLEGVEIDFTQLKIPETEAPLLIEGAGGVLVPLNKHQLIIDLLVYWKIPTIVVASSGLGTINHTLLTLEALRARAVPILGVILNGPKNDGNKRAIEQFGKIEVIGEVF